MAHSAKPQKWRNGHKHPKNLIKLLRLLPKRKKNQFREFGDFTSPMLGHCASSQTVFRFSFERDSFTSWNLSPCGALCRSHSGFFTVGSRPVCGPNPPGYGPDDESEADSKSFDGREGFDPVFFSKSMDSDRMTGREWEFGHLGFEEGIENGGNEGLERDWWIISAMRERDGKCKKVWKREAEDDIRTPTHVFTSLVSPLGRFWL